VTGQPATVTGQPTSPARPLVGNVSANAVVWTVSFPECPSVGTWIGHYQIVGTEEQLRTLWTLALAEIPAGVGSTYTGAEVFVRQAP
jgi:Avidin family